LSHNKIKCLLLENDGIWVGTIKGLNYCDFKSERIERYFYNDNDTNSLPDDRIYDLEKDTFGNIWIGTYRGGLCRLNRNTKTFSRFTHTSDSTSLSADGITYILQDSKEDLWIGTVSGLNKKNKNEDTFIRLESPNQNGLYVLCIYEDKKGRIWVGTRDTGLKLKIHGSNNFRTLSAEDGLAGNTVNGILEDSMGILWISTESGLSRLDPTTFKFDNYNKNDGLACSEFNFNSFHKNEDGLMYFGGYNGIVKFHPDSIRKNTTLPALTFTKLRLFNKEIPIDASGRGMLRKSLAKTDNLTFDYTQNIFSIEFASLNFIHPGKNKYAYQLVGFEDEWNYVNDPVATYMNLSPGRYSLLVKGSNNDDVWNTEPIELNIIVLPPWWRTWLAYAIYGCVILSIAYSLYKFKKMRWKLKHDLQIEQMEKEQQEKLHKAKLNFFTNIAHEIRTPLTLIVSPLDLATERYPNEAFLQKQLQIVKSNTSRLMRLINQLLDFHKQESGNLKLKSSAGNIVALLKEIVFSFSDYAKSRHITLKFNSILDDITMYYDRDGIEKIFCNLLNNAFKFTPAGGEVSILVSMEVSDGNGENAFLQIIVEDNGIGIPQSDLPKIFDRFFQAENARIGESGFGIGLAFTKAIIELHGGTISVESRETDMIRSGYTRFTIFLPFELQQLSENHQSRQELIEETDLLNESASPMEDDLQDRQQRHRYSILLVEDNIEIRNCLKSILSFSYNILEAANGDN
ncbi:MAG: hybrid sensor histidine kinase/response regulator, partial [Marivirga sp.]|nr:hybrid sensor histidine kinase/response regulator [Marivirga sp.]